MIAELLDQPRLSFVSHSEDPELVHIRETIDHAVVIGGRADVEETLCRLLANGRAGTPKTLDLIGHSTARTSLLVLGDWTIDASASTTTAFFRELTEQDVLARLGITAVRLLGCLTANSAHGKWTVCALADILGVDVYGTTGLVLSSFYNGSGFVDARRHVLASANDLRANAIVLKPLHRGEPSAMALDIDTLPPMPLSDRAWPVHVVDPEQARELLCLVQRRNGSTLHGLVAAPVCELALPSSMRDRYHMVQVLLGGELVRVYPHGIAQGVVYPVDDPFELRKLIA